MKVRNFRVSSFYTVAFLIISITGFAMAQSPISSREANDLLNQINTKLTDFQYNVNGDVNRNSISQTEEADISEAMTKLRNTLESFREKVNRGNESEDDAQVVLTASENMNSELRGLKLNAKTLNDWQMVRGLITELGAKYGISASWSQNGPTNIPVKLTNSQLTGTYELDYSRSDDINKIAEDALSSVSGQNLEDAKEDLIARLNPPQNLAIDVQGNRVAIASTLSSQLTFSADGVDRSQTLSDGTNVRVRTSIRGQELTIASLGNNNDYTVVFTSTNNGRGLKVTRRVTTDYLSETVFAESYYTKSDSTARLDIYDNQNSTPIDNNTGNVPNSTSTSQSGNSGNQGSNPAPPVTRSPRIGQYAVRNGEIITGTLENMISTKISQNNDRFRMTVTGPSEFRGAVIEGYISGIDRSNRNPIGKAKLTLNFETIRLTNGQLFDFAGFLQSVTDAKGRVIKVDEEGSAQKSSRNETLKRGGIGAGAGAILGAIFGGAKGAIIGATIGAAGGAGTVSIQNNGDLVLNEGTSITVQSSSPIN